MEPKTSEQTSLGRLELREALSTQPSGVLYRAHDTDLERDVAVLLLAPDSTAAERARAMTRAKALAQSNHPNLQRVYATTTEGERQYITLELVSGTPLSSWLAQPHTDAGQVLDYFLQAGRGLAAAHAEGVTHTNFHPDNIIIDAFGRARLVNIEQGASESKSAVGGVNSDRRAFCRELLAALAECGGPPEVRTALEAAVDTTQGPSLSDLIDTLESSLQRTDDEHLRLLMERLQRLWLDGILDASLGHQSAAPLPMEDLSEVVAPAWEGSAITPGSTTRELSDLLIQAHSGLLLVGAPGAGKTIALLELAKELLQRAKRSSTSPVPVVLNLSSFEGQRELLPWVVDEMVSKYSLPRPSVERWLEHDQLVLLLDALDEVAPRQRKACIESLNHFLKDHAPLMVVTSREEEYQSAGAKLALGSAARLPPLTTESGRALLQHLGLDAMQLPATAPEEHRTPLWLKLVGESDPNGSLAGAESTLNDAYERLLSKAFRPEERSAALPRLVFLAKAMTRTDTSDVWLERLSPQWLPRYVDRAIVWFLAITCILLVQVPLSLGVARLTQRAPGMTAALVLGPLPVIAILTQGFRLKALEKLRWSWRVALRRAPRNVAIGSAVGAVIGLAQHDLAYAPLCGGVGLLLTLINALDSADKPGSVAPNAGTHYSLRNALVLASIGGPPVGLIYAYGWWPFFVDVAHSDVAQWSDPSLPVAACVAMFSWHIVFFPYGGAFVSLHWCLRCVLAWRTPLPLKLVPFLDDCVRRGLLRRIGGGYLFVHRTLQAYLAGMSEGAPTTFNDSSSRDAR